jgi:uncharacterized protein YdhG (YjbR/CyaY superfamily)
MPTTVAEYIAAQPAPTKRVLQTLRTTIRKALPKSEEVISYQIPAYRLHGKTVIHFAGWKKHYSLYPATSELIAKFAKELEPYEVNDKGTIRFPLSEPVPVKLIERIAKFRAKEVAASVKTVKKKTALPKRRA